MYNILVCDDDKEIVKAIEIYLNKEGYNVLKSYNGEDALKNAVSYIDIAASSFYTQNSLHDLVDDIKKNNINFKSEYIVNNIEGIEYARFDFYIRKLNLIIEYDGQQHFEPVEKFGGQDAFKRTQYRDDIKNKYCLENGINLIRIPYWDYKNIEKILDEKLTILKETSTTK